MRDVAVAALVLLAGCSTSDGPCAGAGITQASRFPAGSVDGHADPLGAMAAAQARAGRITDAAWIKQPANAKEKVNVGDYLLINDKIAVYIEGVGRSDAYYPFGGGILGLEPVGPDGAPTGTSQYGEAMVGLSRQAIDPDTVSVLKDGSDGGEAIVRVAGKFANISFLDVFEGLSPDEYNFPAALDYVLEPGAERVKLRLSFMNPDAAAVDLSTNQNVAFFQTFRNQTFTPAKGFATPGGRTPWVGFDGEPNGFIYRQLGSDLNFVISVSGFQLYQASGLSVASCGTQTVDYAELIVASGGIDGALAAMRRTDGDTSWRTLTGVVAEPGGAPVPFAQVHVLDAGGKYLTRAKADGAGAFSVHAPAASVQLTATATGYAVPPAITVDAGASAPVMLQLGAHGTISVHAHEGTAALPVRVQVIPSAAVTDPPDTFGVRTEANGRLHLAFTVDGNADLAVPPGDHRVVVTRGAEYEMLDTMVTVQAGQTSTVDAPLVRSVDSTGVMCADFHIHSFYSADSSDPVEYKVRGAIADGLEIPVSSEHEWIIDFQPVIQQMGLTKWAYGFPSEEFTTFTWGHFGVVPITPRPDQLNNGAVDWIGKNPPEVFGNIAALPESPVLIINHPSGGGFSAYFSATHFNRTTAVGDPDMWSDQFEAVEVFNDSDFESNRNASVADWFALLNAGRKVWAAGNSDSHSLRSSPAGYPRTCLHFGHDDPTQLSASLVRDQLRAGHATVSGGLYMTVLGPGGVGPGDTLTGAGPWDLQVVVQSPSWLEAQQVEMIVDGETKQTLQLQEVAGPGPAHRYELIGKVDPPSTPGMHWVIFHANNPSRDLAPLWPGRKPFAVSNPIFF